MYIYIYTYIYIYIYCWHVRLYMGRASNPTFIRVCGRESACVCYTCVCVRVCECVLVKIVRKKNKEMCVWECV